MRPAVVAHRGAAQVAPENSLAAFLDARHQGADGIEFDVRQTADGALVIAHDPGLEGLGPISDLELTDLPASIPTLAQALTACAGLVINVEIKSDGASAGHHRTEALCSHILSEIVDSGLSGDVVVSSFDVVTATTTRRLAPDLAVGLLALPGSDLFEALGIVVANDLSALHPFVHHVTAELVTACHNDGVAVNVWTVNDASEIQRLSDLGVDAIITDDVVKTRSILDA